MSGRMTSSQVKEALLKRWPPDQYLSIQEAPQNSDRSGRKLDLVVVSLWKSRGLSLDGVEVKVSMSDWKRELDEPDKADWWHAHVHRFWIAAPSDVAKKIKPQLPVGWGLLSCSETATTVLVHPEPNKTPVPFTWPETVGLMRANSGLSLNILAREFEKGRKLGVEVGLATSARGGLHSDPEEVQRLRGIESQYLRLKDQVESFEAASGLTLGSYSRDAERIGEAAKLVMSSYLQGPIALDARLAAQAEQARSVADSIDKLRSGLTKALDASQ